MNQAAENAISSELENLASAGTAKQINLTYLSEKLIPAYYN